MIILKVTNVKLGIDIRHLSRGYSGGIAEYTINLLDALVRNFPEETFKLFSSGRYPPDIANKWLMHKNISLHHLALPNRFLDPTSRLLAIPSVDKFIGGVDVFLSPHFLLTALSDKCRRVMIIHDLSFVRYPEFFSVRDRLWHWLMSPKTQVKLADVVVSVSDSTKRDLISIWRIDRNKIHTVYPGIAQFAEHTSINYARLVADRYNLPDNFILALSVIEPRKNYVSLIRAFEVFKTAHPDTSKDLGLVIAGPLSKRSDEVSRAVKSSLFSKAIFLPGFIDEKDKAAIYRLAKVFVYPSVFEGFGFPPLEAMAAGIPVIVSARASLPEIVANAALCVDPYDISALASAIMTMLEDTEARDFLVNAGLNRAASFSWDQAAQRIYHLCSQAAAS